MRVHESIPNDATDENELEHAKVCYWDVPFNDDYNINSKASNFKQIIDCCVEGQELSDEEMK